MLGSLRRHPLATGGLAVGAAVAAAAVSAWLSTVRTCSSVRSPQASSRSPLTEASRPSRTGLVARRLPPPTASTSQPSRPPTGGSDSGPGGGASSGSPASLARRVSAASAPSRRRNSRSSASARTPPMCRPAPATGCTRRRRVTVPPCAFCPRQYRPCALATPGRQLYVWTPVAVRGR